MKNKKLIGWVGGILTLIVILVTIIVLNEPGGNGISRAMAYKAAALSVTSRTVCEQQEKDRKQSHFSAKEQKQWYVKYIEYLYSAGYLTEESFDPLHESAEDFITYKEADALAEAISGELKGAVKLTKANQKKPYPQDLWWKLYDKILQLTDDKNEHVKEQNLLLYGTPKNMEEAPQWTAYTSEGIFGFEGLAMDAYIDREVKVLIRNKEIIRLVEQISEDVVYRNAWLQAGGSHTFAARLGSVKREFPLSSDLGKPEELANQVADLYLQKGKLKKVVLKKDRIAGKVLAVKADSVEIEGYGTVPLDEYFKVYKVYGDFKQQKRTDVLVGYDIQEFVVADGKLCAALTVRPFDARSIRVLIMNTGFHTIFHSSITVSSNEELLLSHGEVVEHVPAGESITINSDDERIKGGRMVLQTVSPNGTVAVSSIERAQGNIPSYGGRLEISREKEGLVLVNELYLEDYLTKVVPSEMPAYFEIEALKAQAVCARTYAYKQIRSNAYSQYGAHVDDSTRYQVYNNIETDPKTRDAVNATYGKLLMLDDEPVEAYYFSTSCGHTTDGTIWGADLSEVPYLQGVALRDSRDIMNLTTNEEFSTFIKDKKFDSYDSAYPMYRWETTINSLELAEKIKGVGAILNLTVIERGTGGIAKKLRVEGSDGNKIIEGQGQIRSTLGNKNLKIIKNDGKAMTELNSLPSAFIAIDVEGINVNNVITFRIYGGGYGHGVGMSQNGAQAMAKAGKNYEEILKFFYEGIEVKEMEGGEG